MDPREIFPPEIWELIFDKVEDPQDWLNLYRASPCFQEIVGEKRISALFTKVFPHVVDHLWGNLYGFLGLRLMCRQWKVAVDKMLENPDRPDPHITSIQATPYYFNNSACISSFLTKFETHSGNPFVGRLATLLYNYNLSSDAISEYSLSVARLLDRFGAQLKSLSVVFTHTGLVNVASRLESCLHLMPNLESLTIHRFNTPDDNRGEGGGVGLKRVLGVEPRQLSPNLRSISFDFIGLVSERNGELLDLQSAVARMSCNPNSLRSVQTIGFPPELLTYPNVDTAVVSLNMSEDHYSYLAGTTPWPLSKLNLNHTGAAGGHRPLSQLFDCVEHFQSTLLWLRFDRPLLLLHGGPSTGLSRKLDLPHLRKLIIQEDPSMSLEIFTRLANLEVLSIHKRRHAPINANNDVAAENRRFIECVQREVVRCRLWEVLPKLRKIELNGVVNVSSQGRLKFSSKVNSRV